MRELPCGKRFLIYWQKKYVDLNLPFKTIRTSVGAARLLTTHSETKFEDTCARGGWYMESMAKAHMYIARILDSVSRAGKDLSG